MKTTVRYHLTPIRMAIIRKSTNNKHWRGWEEKETLLHCWWKCKLVQPLWRTVWRSHKKTKNRVAMWSSSLTPGHISEQNHKSKRHMQVLLVVHASTAGGKVWSHMPHSQKKKKNTLTDICTLEALFTTAKIWKQSKWPLTDKWLKKMWYIYTMDYYLTIKKEWNNTICSNMDGPRNYQNKWSKPEKDKYHMILLGS